jgi:photosystem II stability/assembly factor-like uncharacterized protein
MINSKVFRPSLYLSIFALTVGLFVFSASMAHASQWITRGSSPTGFTAVAFSNQNNGVAIATGGEVFATTNGNHSNWVQTDTLGLDLSTVAYAPNTSFAYIGSLDSTVYKSADRGSSWAVVAPLSVNSVQSLYFIDENTGWGIDSNGEVFKTTDGALSWQSVLIPAGFTLYDVFFEDSLNGWAVGSAGITMFSNDGGVSWNMAIAPTGEDLFSVIGSGISVYASGSNNVFVKSSDAGLTWNAVSSIPQTFSNGGILLGLDMDPSGIVWVSGDDDDVAYSLDRGDTWVDATFTAGSFSFMGVVSHSSSMTNVVGSDGNIYVFDGGAPNPPTNVSIAPDGNSTTNKQPTVSWTAATDSETSVDHYNVILNGEVPLNVGGVLSYSYLNDLPLGSHSVVVQAVDLGGSSANSSTYNFTITAADTTAPAVGTVSPTTATINVAVDLLFTATDAGGVNSCNLEVTDGNGGFMSYDAGLSKWKKSHTFTSTGTFQARATCIDNIGNITVGQYANVVVSAVVVPDPPAPGDVAGPTVTTVTPTKITRGVATNVNVTAFDDSGVASCNLEVDGQNIGAMTYDPAILKWKRPTTFLTSKTYQVRSVCTDSSSNVTNGPLTSVSVSTQVFGDTTKPTVSNVQPTTVSMGSTQTVTATVSDNVGVTSCYLYVGGLAKGQMAKSNSTVSKSFTFTGTTDYSVVVQVQCNDAQGNVGVGARTVNVKKNAVGGIVPSASYSYITATPASAQANNSDSVTLTVDVRNGLNQALISKTVKLITSRTAYDTITIISSKTNSKGQATFSIRSKKAGLSGVYAVADNMTIADKAINFIGVGETSDPGALIKLDCPAGSSLAVNHPCKAVYFIGADGKRHAFPNSKVYFSWYTDFGGVKTVQPETMSSFMLGKTVTYRPGIKMVKFQTVNTVYVVSKGGLLRAIPDEATAVSMYGSTWNKQIDDISDAFFSHYTFGNAVSASAKFNKTAEKNNVITLLQNGV